MTRPIYTPAAMLIDVVCPTRLRHTAYVSLGLPSSLSQESYALSLVASKHLYICTPSPHLTLQMHTILVPHVVFQFSMECKWHVVIEEDKDNSLQFAKVFPTKLLKLPICQSFPPPPFCAIQ